MEKQYKTFKEFYPFYLSQHENKTSRYLHYIGTSLGLVLFVYALVVQNPWLLLVSFVCGYGFAWVGHFFFEKNKPATFQYPWYSFLGDWVMLWQFLTGKRR
ncbi:DUF962 domain-containing protein [Thalassotalea agarivorans]|uniref:DUF962 domain-containing protein n=1 Tax=Thalassotalea agarivorans TaxID=349064 RepID=A0A1I0FFM6_THASX|nr:DUF962 domain-containing protein [Thalassotalea agarivorans]SET56986.1 hypothetical protein SAMN05660429_02114 [Thalassotalea agarivorans]